MKFKKIAIYSVLVTLFTFISIRSFAQFETVKIGNQEWMSKNLDVTKFRNGDEIPQVTSDEEWVKAGKNKQPAWCYYSNSSTNGNIYHKIYNWYAVTDSRGLAPEGWRIANDEDFAKLTAYYQKDRKLGYAVLLYGGKSQFNALLGGWRGSKEGNFKDIHTYTAIWSSTEKGKWASYFEFNASFFVVDMREAGKGAGCYVRCIK
jgi:uncharacterized protein (TIGR02145 family)